MPPTRPLHSRGRLRSLLVSALGGLPGAPRTSLPAEQAASTLLAVPSSLNTSFPVSATPCTAAQMRGAFSLGLERQSHSVAAPAAGGGGGGGRDMLSHPSWTLARVGVPLSHPATLSCARVPPVMHCTATSCSAGGTPPPGTNTSAAHTTGSTTSSGRGRGRGSNTSKVAGVAASSSHTPSGPVSANQGGCHDASSPALATSAVSSLATMSAVVGPTSLKDEEEEEAGLVEAGGHTGNGASGAGAAGGAWATQKEEEQASGKGWEGRSEEEMEEVLRQRWKHLPEPEGPGPFPCASSSEESHMWSSPQWASAFGLRRHIFCNRSLNMQSIEAVGFDMDYTVAQYRADTFEALAYQNTVEKLVNRFGYPDDLLSWTFDWRYMVRGLVVDKKRGNILKMDRHKYVKLAYHGFRALSTEERRQTYNSTRARVSFDEPDYALIDTLFTLAEAYLFAQLVDFCDAFPSRCPPQVVVPGTHNVSYEAIYKNVRSAVDLCHRDGTLKSAVAKDPRKFLHKDEQIVPMLKMLRDSGRKIFLVTNSLWDFTHVVMNCVVGNCGSTPDRLRTYDWLKLFDVVITGSAKPGFFQDDNRAPVFEVDVGTGMLMNTDEGSPAAQIGDLAPPPTVAEGVLTPGVCQVYQGGNVGHLHRLLGIASGSQVLYVGDHIYGDILRSKKTLGWRTMLVVPELVREVHVLHSTVQLQKAFHEYRHQIDSLDDTIQRMAWALRFDNLGEEEQQKVGEEMKAFKFHPVWGMLMKTGYQNSRFAHQVERFACLYTSHVANLAYYSPDKSYRTVEDFMPHDMDILHS